MSSAAALKSEIAGIPAYLTQSAALVPNISVLKSAQAVTIGAKIQNLRALSMSDATALKHLIGEVGWSPDENANLASLIDEAVQKATMPAVGRRASQRCPTWELYPTATEWKVLSDADTPWSVKFDRVKRICMRLRLFLPAEPTKGRILDSLLVASGLPTERDPEWFLRLKRLKMALDPLQHEKTSPGKTLDVYPTSPQDLPKELFDSAYPEEGPAFREFAELGGHTTDVRKSSKAFQRSKSQCHDPLPIRTDDPMKICQPTAAPEQTFASIAQSLGQATNPMDIMTAMFASAWATRLQPQQSAPPLLGPPAQGNPSQGTSQPPETKANEPAQGKPAQGGVDEESDEEESHGAPPLSPLEQDAAMRRALQKRALAAKLAKDNKRTGKSKTKSKATPKTTSKTTPKATATVMKRPAKAPTKGKKSHAIRVKPTSKEKCVKAKAALAVGKYKCTATIPWNADDHNKNRNTFQSLWYGRHKRAMLVRGVVGERMAKELNRILTLAGRVWDEHQ
jgi:hypothetical protein